jgi:hypothetical protein
MHPLCFYSGLISRSWLAQLYVCVHESGWMDAGGEPLRRCSGCWIDFDEGSKTGTVLTTAHLISTKSPSDIWKEEAHYDSKANVSRCFHEL